MAEAGEGAAFREMEGTTAGLFPYDEEAIVGRGEIVPRSWWAGTWGSRYRTSPERARVCNSMTAF